MNPNIVVHLLIILIIGGVLIYIYRANKVFYSCFTNIIINSFINTRISDTFRIMGIFTKKLILNFFLYFFIFFTFVFKKLNQKI